MRAEAIDRERLRRLAESTGAGTSVLSVYLNLDPREFATPEARATSIGSVVDEAERRARADNAIRADVRRVREYLEGADFQGAQGLAVFSCETAGLFETFHLPRPVSNEVVVGPAPFVEPLTEMAASGDWLVVLANRRVARFFRGSTEHLEDIGRLDSDTHGRHDQGGWSQARYQRSVDNEAQHHLSRAAAEIDLRLRRASFQHLLLGAPDEAYASLERELSKAARGRLRGRVPIDVENTTSDEVLAAAGSLMERFERERETNLLERMREGVATGGRGAAGTADVLGALTEQRVEVLLLDERFEDEGERCTSCGLLRAVDAAEMVCPADGAPMEHLDAVGEAAVERALLQDADLVVLRDRPELAPVGGIAAVLRF
jgi:peptide subunit release factor 1 (eRF1)